MHVNNMRKDERSEVMTSWRHKKYKKGEIKSQFFLQFGAASALPPLFAPSTQALHES